MILSSRSEAEGSVFSCTLDSIAGPGRKQIARVARDDKSHGGRAVPLPQDEQAAPGVVFKLREANGVVSDHAPDLGSGAVAGL